MAEEKPTSSSSPPNVNSAPSTRPGVIPSLSFKIQPEPPPARIGLRSVSTDGGPSPTGGLDPQRRAEIVKANKQRRVSHALPGPEIGDEGVGERSSSPVSYQEGTVTAISPSQASAITPSPSIGSGKTASARLWSQARSAVHAVHALVDVAKDADNGRGTRREGGGEGSGAGGDRGGEGDLTYMLKSMASRGPGVQLINISTPITKGDLRLRGKAMAVSTFLFAGMYALLSLPEVSSFLTLCYSEAETTLMTCTCEPFSVEAIKGAVRKGLIGWFIGLTICLVVLRISKSSLRHSFISLFMATAVYFIVLVGTGVNVVYAWLAGSIVSLVTATISMGWQKLHLVAPLFILLFSLQVLDLGLNYCIPYIRENAGEQGWRAFLICWPIVVSLLRSLLRVEFQMIKSAVTVLTNEDIFVVACIAAIWCESLLLGGLYGFDSAAGAKNGVDMKQAETEEEGGERKKVEDIGKALYALMIWVCQICSRCDYQQLVARYILKKKRRPPFRSTRIWRGADIAIGAIPWLALVLAGIFDTALYGPVGENCTGFPLRSDFKSLADNGLALTFFIILVKICLDGLFVYVAEDYLRLMFTAPAHNINIIVLTLICWGLYTVAVYENEWQMKFYS